MFISVPTKCLFCEIAATAVVHIPAKVSSVMLFSGQAVSTTISASLRGNVA